MCRHVFTLLFVLTLVQPAAATVQFYNVYKAVYLKDHPDKGYVKEVQKVGVKCLTCHQGKNFKRYNGFGIHLVDLLDRKKDNSDQEKISAAIYTVMEKHVVPDDNESETYRDRVNASKWPGGELKELKKEN